MKTNFKQYLALLAIPFLLVSFTAEACPKGKVKYRGSCVKPKDPPKGTKCPEGSTYGRGGQCRVDSDSGENDCPEGMHKPGGTKGTECASTPVKTGDKTSPATTTTPSGGVTAPTLDCINPPCT